MSELAFSKEALIKKGSETGWDARKIVKAITAIMLIGGIIYGIGTYVLPWAVNFAWDLVSLMIAGGTVFALFIIFSHIWKRLPLINALIAKYTLGLIIEWDEFIIQEQQIKKAEEDIEEMLGEKEKIEGKYVELAQKLKSNQEEYQTNMKAAEIASRNGDSEHADDYMLAATRNQAYVENIGPICDDMKFIIDFSQDIHKVLKRKIKNAKADLQANKDVFYSAQSGAKALLSAKKAMIGDVELNSQAELAKQRVKEKIAMSIGQMRSSMEILTDVSKEQNFRDKAKLELAKSRLQAINQSTGSDAVPVPTSINFQGIQKQKRFGDLI